MFKAAIGFSTSIGAGITPASTSIALSANAIAALITLGIDGTNYTEAALSDGVSFEIVRLTEVIGGTAVVVTRAQEGTGAGTFAAGTTLRFVWTQNGIQEEAAAVGAAITLNSNIVGAVTGGPAVFNIDLPIYAAGANLVLTGTYPNYTLGLDPLYAPAVGGTVTAVSVSSDLTVANATTTPALALSTIFPTASGGNAFGAGVAASGYISGIRVSNTGRLMEVVASSLANGVYTNAIVTVTNGIITALASGGGGGGFGEGSVGSGTVTGVNAGTGISITGTPTVNPTIGISNTGVVVGTYEGVQINAQGQFVAVPGGFAPISSIITTTTGVTIASGGTGIKSINISTGSDSVPGLARFADNAEATNFSTTHKALDPSRLKLALNSLGSMIKSAGSVGSITGPALVTVLQTVALTAGDAAMVTANVVFSDPTAGVDEYNQSYAIGIYVNGVAHTVTPAFKSGMKSLQALVTSFVGGNIELRVTTPAGAQITQSTLSAILTADIP